jgi:hypothetical protein
MLEEVLLHEARKVLSGANVEEAVVRWFEDGLLRNAVGFNNPSGQRNGVVGA